MAFDLLWWFNTKKKQKRQKKNKKNKKNKKKIVCLLFFNIIGVIKGHLGSRDFLFLLKLGESIVRSFSMDPGNTLGMRF